jgi:hypothetical protein
VRKEIVPPLRKESAVPSRNVSVTLSVSEIRSLFAAVNTAGMLSAGRVADRDALEGTLMSALAKLEDASGVERETVDEWAMC